MSIIRTPRSREVGQSYLTSIWTTFIALFSAVSIVWRQRPELVRSAAVTQHELLTTS